MALTKVQASLTNLGIVNVLDFGAVGDGVTDDSTAIQAAIESAYDNNSAILLFDPNKTYLVTDQISFNGYPATNGIDTGLTVIANGATIKLAASTPTSVGHVVGIGRGAYVGEDGNVELTGDITWIGGIVDVNNNSGENGFGLSRTRNVHIQNVTVQNGSFSASIEGGRGFTTHAASRNVVIENCRVYNMGDGYHISTVPDNRADINGTDLYTITNITQATSAVITTSATHNILVGEFVYISQVNGMTELNPSYTNRAEYEVTAVTATTITIDVNSSAYTAYTSGGNVVRKDDLYYRNHAISFINCLARECDHSGFNCETANEPRTVELLNHNVLVDGLTLINCGSNSTDRGIINGNNTSGLKMRNVTIHNDSSFPVSDVIRGSWQNCHIDADINVHTARSIINHDLIAGDEPSLDRFPYHTTFNSCFNLMVDGRVTLSGNILQSADRTGSSVDYCYRNYYKVGIYGEEGGTSHTLMDTYVQNSNSYVDFWDIGNAQRIRGFSDDVDTSAPFSGNNAVTGPLHINDSARADLVLDSGSGNNSRISAREAGTENGYFEYRHANDRWYMMLANSAETYQFTANNIFPSSDNLRDLGTASLRMRTIYAGTGTINTSDAREKTFLTIGDAEKAAALEIKANLRKFKWNDAIALKGDNARIHFGASSQQIAEIMASHGLDAANYGFYCYDQWNADEDVEAGDRYGIRYDELLAFIIGAM